VAEGVDIMKDWVQQAKTQGTLRITKNRNCPYCNMMQQINTPNKLNACEKHLWVNNEWFEGLDTSS